jgi:DMSO/TMAO reductase YedYZ molybdopterin-dependent catalytic subunit
LDYPVTQTVGQGQTVLSADTWKLVLNGAGDQSLEMNYQTLLALPASELTATLDCTSGWFSTHTWRGVWLEDLLAQANVNLASVTVILRDVSGYPAVFTAGEAAEILLATHVDGVALDHWHGFPVRAVSPSRRGWQWVKWLTTIEVITA